MHRRSNSRASDPTSKAESGIGHAQRAPLKGLRFECIKDAQRHFDDWRAGRSSVQRRLREASRYGTWPRD